MEKVVAVSHGDYDIKFGVLRAEGIVQAQTLAEALGRVISGSGHTRVGYLSSPLVQDMAFANAVAYCLEKNRAGPIVKRKHLLPGRDPYASSGTRPFFASDKDSQELLKMLDKVSEGIDLLVAISEKKVAEGLASVVMRQGNMPVPKEGLEFEPGAGMYINLDQEMRRYDQSYGISRTLIEMPSGKAIKY